MNNTALQQPKYGHLTSHGFWEEEKPKRTNEKYHLHTDVIKIRMVIVIKLKKHKQLDTPI